jgi:mannitol/fructose-specific phosphotransferase system IIA component (Ntr-type)
LQLLSKIAFLLADSEIRKQLLTATMEEILAILADF